jgi:uncharacterized membrane protein
MKRCSGAAEVLRYRLDTKATTERHWAGAAMNTENPYQSPTANVVTDTQLTVKQPRRVAMGRGSNWIAAGWRYFAANPGPWIGAAVVWLLISSVGSLIPVVSIAINVITPVFMGGLIAGCVDQDDGRPFRFDHLFSGFRDQFGPLAVLGLIQLGLFIGLVLALGIVVAGVLFAAGYADIFDNPNLIYDSGALLAVLLVTLIGLLVAMPIVMAMWFAPALVVHGKKAPVEALLLSFRGCMKNVMPFLPYGLLLLLLGVFVVATAFLGAMVVMPITVASIYVGYKDIFLYDQGVLGHD